MYLKQKLFCQTLSPRGKKTIRKENKINSMFGYEKLGMCYWKNR